MRNARGLALMQFDNYHVDWAEVASIQPHTLLIMDPHHFEPAREVVGPEGLIVWRPTEPGKPLWEHFTPWGWAEYICNHWPPGPGPDLLQPWNEPNLMLEWGYPDGSQQGAEHLRGWGLSFVGALRECWLGVKIMSPPLSPSHGANDLECLGWISSLVRECDVLGAHCYWATPAGLYDPNWRDDEAFRYRQYHAMFPDMDMVIAECNRPASGELDYGGELFDYANMVAEDDYVKGACAFVLDSPPPLFEVYRLAGTPALARWAELVRGGAAEFLCPHCEGRVVVSAG